MSWQDFYILSDLCGGKRICETRVSIDSVLSCLEQGNTPEEIVRSYPALTLGQVHDAIEYIHGHPEEIAEHKRLQAARRQELHREQDCNPSPVVQRLRKLMTEKNLCVD